MTMLTSEQLTAAQKANFDTLFGLTQTLAEGIEKLVALNTQAIKSTLTDAQTSLIQALSVRDPREWGSLQAALVSSIPEKVQRYGQQVTDIVSTTQTEFARVAQAQSDECNRRVQTLVEDLAKSAPAGSEAAIAAWKSAINAGSTLVETAQKSYQQAAQVAESNFAAATAAASKATRRAAEQAGAAKG